MSVGSEVPWLTARILKREKPRSEPESASKGLWGVGSSYLIRASDSPPLYPFHPHKMEVLAALPSKFVVLNESIHVKHLAQCLSLGIYVNECVPLLVLLLFFWE